MQISDFIPTAALRPYIASYKVIESAGGSLNRVLPSTSLAMAFCFKGQVSYQNESQKGVLPFALLTGLQKSARLINYDQDTATLIVMFKETGAAAFCRQPLHELFGQSVGLDNYFKISEITALQYQFRGCNTHSERIALVEHFLLSKLLSYDTDKLILQAADKIRMEKGNIKIKELAALFCLSQDAFEKRFRKVIGTTPKQFAYLIRMNAVIAAQKSSASFLDWAFDSGYYDQSHFIKDFKTYTGLTPSNFFSSASFW